MSKHETEKKGKRKYSTELDYRLMRILAGIKSRCTNPKSTGFHRYGGRGIRYLLNLRQLRKLWHRDNADGMNRPSIDRIDGNGNYVFDNCRFIEVIDNIKNRTEYKPASLQSAHFIGQQYLVRVEHRTAEDTQVVVRVFCKDNNEMKLQFRILSGHADELIGLLEKALHWMKVNCKKRRYGYHHESSNEEGGNVQDISKKIP